MNNQSKDSQALQKKLFTDGIQYSFLMAKLAYNRLLNDLLVLSQNEYHRRKKGTSELSKNDNFSCELNALSNSWQVIDSVNRLRELLIKTPSIKQKAKELQLFLRQTINVEYLRNNVQHLNEQIIEYVKNNIPAWGTLNWVAKLDETGELLLFSLVPGRLFERTTPFINPCGKRFNPPIGLVTLCVDKEICLSELVETQLNGIGSWLQSTVNIPVDGVPPAFFASIEFVPRQ